MKYIFAFFQFWYDFIVGDDWTIAVAVAAGLVVTWILAHNNANIWWLLPVIVVFALTLSLWREAEKIAKRR
jgi:hypothetical protein